MSVSRPSRQPTGRIQSMLRQFIDSESSAGIMLMVTAAAAILAANSPLATYYFGALKIYLGPLNLLHWINDGLMAVFFLLVGLEIKREMIDGHLSSWPRRLLPGAAAAGGMAVPALIYVAFNAGDPAMLRGWAIPTATDIAFALGVLSLLGPRVPTSLKVFLAALAIIDDLGAVLVIAVFYTADISMAYLAAAAVTMLALFALNRARVNTLLPYLFLGVLLWVLVLKSGVHATLAGVALALTIPIVRTPGKPEASDAVSPLHRLEHRLVRPVAFAVVPIFGFANAGVSFAGFTPATLVEPVTLGIAAGLFVGKLVGVFGAVVALVRSRVVDLPAGASWAQVVGVALLCGIGFTMSLFIGLLAFDDPAVQDRVKIAILAGSLASGIAGFIVLRIAEREAPPPPRV